MRAAPPVSAPFVTEVAGWTFVFVLMNQECTERGLTRKRWLVPLLGIAGLVGLIGLTVALQKPRPIQQRSIAELSAELEAGSSPGARHWQSVWKGLPGAVRSRVPWLQPSDYRAIRSQAAVAVEARGASASNAVPALVWGIAHESVQDYDIAHHEFLALGKIGPPARDAVPELLKWLTNNGAGRGTWMRGAAWALPRIAPDDPHVAAALVQARAQWRVENEYADINPEQFREPVESWRPSGRRNLVRAIALLRPQSGQTMSALYDALEHGDYGEQATAADVLGALRPVSPETVAKLKATLVRAAGESPPENLNALAKAWVDAFERRYGPMIPAWAPGKIDESNAAGFAHLTLPRTALEKFETIYLPAQGFPGWGLGLRAIRALGSIGPEAREAVPVLVQEYEAKTNLLRFEAAVAVCRISGPSPQVLAVFKEGLATSDARFRQAAMTGLKELGADCPEARALSPGAVSAQ